MLLKKPNCLDPGNLLQIRVSHACLARKCSRHNFYRLSLICSSGAYWEIFLVVSLCFHLLSICFNVHWGNRDRGRNRSWIPFEHPGFGYVERLPSAIPRACTFPKSKSPSMGLTYKGYGKNAGKLSLQKMHVKVFLSL
jgi:hypothetical protein